MTGLTVLAPLTLNTGLSCVAFTYAGRMFIGLTADVVTFPEVDQFVREIHLEFGELLALAEPASDNHRSAV